MIERFLRYLLARFYPEKTARPCPSGYNPVEMGELLKRKWTREEVIDIARKAGIILPYEQGEAPTRPPDKEELMLQWRDRAYQADPNGATRPPPDLRNMVTDLKALGSPFLLICLHRSYGDHATHGWCNGSNWGPDILAELARCAELNFKQELEKCAGRTAGKKSYSGPKGYLE